LIPVAQLERHAFTNQGFVPMSRGGSDSLDNPGASYIVVVAPNGEDDRPDLKSLRAFHVGGAQGIVYNTGVWRQFLTFSFFNFRLMS
jgi:allantoicase